MMFRVTNPRMPTFFQSAYLNTGRDSSRFRCGYRIGLRRPLSKLGVFAQVEPITQNKLGLPPYSLLRASSLSSTHPLISVLWVVI